MKIFGIVIAAFFFVTVAFSEDSETRKSPTSTISQCSNNCPPDTICTLDIKLNCSYADYQAEHCQCCKHCTYPPPDNLCPKSPKRVGACPLFVLASCNDDQYIEDICEACKHCRAPAPINADATTNNQPGASAPNSTTTCSKKCTKSRCKNATVKLNCQYADYQAERCNCCTKCTYPPPRKIVCPPPTGSVFPLCIFKHYPTCTKDQYLEEMCFSCKHCPYLPDNHNNN